MDINDGVPLTIDRNDEEIDMYIKSELCQNAKLSISDRQTWNTSSFPGHGCRKPLNEAEDMWNGFENLADDLLREDELSIVPGPFLL